MVCITKIFPHRKHNGQLVLKMSCNILVLDHFNFMQTLLENIKIEQLQLFLCEWYVNLKIRPVQYEKITITNVNVNILNCLQTQSSNIYKDNESFSGWFYHSKPNLG